MFYFFKKNIEKSQKKCMQNLAQIIITSLFMIFESININYIYLIHYIILYNCYQIYKKKKNFTKIYRHYSTALFYFIMNFGYYIENLKLKK